MSKSPHSFDWGELAFGSKKPLSDLQAVFIAAPRQLSIERFTQLVKTYLPQGNIVLGITKEAYVDGLENQPQFSMLKVETVRPIIDKVAASASKYKIYTLHYFQRETNYILEKVSFSRTVFVNGSWHHSFHLQPLYYTLANRHIPYELVSPFSDEAEAIAYEKSTDKLIPPPKIEPAKSYSNQEMLELANQAARQSYDHTNQTGVALGRKNSDDTYQALLTAYNKVVPYQSFAMHMGSQRERFFSPPNDLNHYDAIHAEVAMLIEAQRQNVNLSGTTVFINVLPCPTCGRMLSATDINEVVYQLDHSSGYTLELFERTGKQVTRRNT